MTAYKLARHKGVHVAFAAMALFYGFAFFTLAAVGINLMFPQQFGELAVSGEVEAWAGMQLCGSLFMAFGLLINGRWRWSPALRLVGSVIVAALTSVLAYSASTATEGAAFMVYCSGFSALGWFVSFCALVDFRAALMWGAEDGRGAI